ncbi:TPA: hypothetical protein R8G36_005157 [Citrobacter braakii]|nr:hypothetical protein [Citrobacter braakii]
MRAAQGKLFSLEGCGHEAQPPPGFTTTQGRTGRPLPNGGMADSASPRDGFTGLRPDTGKDNAQRQGESVPTAACGPLREAWRGSSIARPGGVSVNRPS